tara:strand:+ start:2193 stop:2696 length:504 start_codon:yes stop_codon:yes gene_type:complete
MVLENYSKADLKSIVEIYNLGLDESQIKKKKADLIKAMKGVKKSFDEKDIDKKLKKHNDKKDKKDKKDKVDPKQTKITDKDFIDKKLKKDKKDKVDPKQPKITDKFHTMPDGSIHTGAKHTKNSQPVDPARKKIIQKYQKLIENETDKAKKKELSVKMNQELAQLKK